MAGCGTVTAVVEVVIFRAGLMDMVTLPHPDLLILIVAAIFEIIITCLSGAIGAVVTEP